MQNWRKRILNGLGIKGDYKTPENKRKLRNIIILVLVGIIVLPKLIGFLFKLEVFQPKKEAEVFEADAVMVKPEYLEDSISSTGTIRAYHEVNLSAEVSGKVTGLHINEGSLVKAGNLLVKVNDNHLQAEVVRLESNIKVLEETRERQYQLFERGGVTQEVYDNTLMQLNNLKAEFATVQAEIERTEVKAPFDGVVGLTYISDGAYVTPTTKIASLQNMDSVRVDFSVPERYSPDVNPGNEIQFSVQGIDSLFTGRVIATEPQIDPRTRTLQVRAISNNEDKLLKPGAFANIKLILNAYDEALTVPAVSLIPDGGDYKVFQYKNGKVNETYVKTGIRLRDRVQVKDGIAEGDTILINGLMQLNDSSDVKIKSLN